VTDGPITPNSLLLAHHHGAQSDLLPIEWPPHTYPPGTCIHKYTEFETKVLFDLASFCLYEKQMQCVDPQTHGEKVAMPIKSYLVYPTQGKQADLEAQLRTLPECEVLPATNHELLVLITDTNDETAEKVLEAKLKEIETLQCLALVAGYSDA
jgi:nitrate reductase NapAB chaperone NapD